MNNDNELLKLDNQLCFGIYATSREFTKIYRPFLQKFNLTYPQYLVLLVLWETPLLSVKDLGDKLYLDSGTLTPLLKRMEEASLLTRTRSKEDERKVMIEITKQGLALRKEAVCIPTQVFEATNISPEKYLAWLTMTREMMTLLKKNENK